jgi:hypothetical protein
MLSALLMLRRLGGALRVALREEDFGRILGAGAMLIAVGTVTFTLGNGWSMVDGLYVAVATLTTSSILDPRRGPTTRRRRARAHAGTGAGGGTRSTRRVY